MKDLRFQRLRTNVISPVYSRENSAAFDVFYSEFFSIILKPHFPIIINTGLVFDIPKGVCLQVWDRSSYGALGIHRFAGLIDWDYRGELRIVLCNCSSEEGLAITFGNKIAQILPVRYEELTLIETPHISLETERGDKGFGSTGK